MDREVPLYTLEGVRDAQVSVHPFSTEDKLGLALHRFRRAPSDDVVLLVHGLTTSTDMFIMPEHENLVSYLLAHGFPDVFTLDSRMSNRFSYNLAPHAFTLDDVALHDYPAAVAAIRREIGPERRLHVVSHCLGAVSFMMSLFGGAVTGISSVVANSAALVVRVPGWSAVKLAVTPFVLESLLGVPYVSPEWRSQRGLRAGKAIAALASLLHPGCDVPACHMLSLMWGAGDPALYAHRNLHDVTHRRSGDLYGGTSLNYHRHVRTIVRAGRAVKQRPDDARYAALPDDYLARAAEVTTPVLLMTGADNHVFADSNVVCHAALEAVAPGRHSLLVFDGYGHQDVFMGARCAEDVFPHIASFLCEHAGAPTRRPGASRGAYAA